MKIAIWCGCIVVYSVVVTACRLGGVTFGALPTALLFLLLVILPAPVLCRAWDRKRAQKQGPVQVERPEEISEAEVLEIKNPALRARAELYRSSRESAGQPEKSWPAPGEKLCGTPFVKAGKEVPPEPAPKADAPKKAKHTRLEVALSIICAVLVVSTAVLGYKVYEFRETVIAFVNVNDELLQENKALESEVEELQREVSSMSSGSSGLDDFTAGYLEAREQMGQPYYVASVNSDIFHRPSCDYVDNILEENRTYYLSKLRAIIDGKQPCSVCMP